MSTESSTTTSPSSVKFTRRPAKSSSLRKSININDDQDAISAATGDGDDDDRPAVIRPAVSRSGSTKLKKKASSSRLSFGVTEDHPDPSDASAPFTPKKNPSAASLTQRATENSAIRASLSSRSLPTRSFGAEQEQPSYSRAYLEELQSSTPNTPADLDRLHIHDNDDNNDHDYANAMALDDAELDGAVFVPTADLSISSNATGHIPSTAEIREKKERRARLAKEGNAYASGDNDEEDEDGYISLLPKKTKDDTRLIAEDEDLGEGYDEFVEDGRLELGKRGERDARRRQRMEMAELINTAEGASEDEDTDSDAERKAAYEEAQTRAAMDGLHRVTADDEDGVGVGGISRLVIPKMKPLPELGSSLARMRELVKEMEEQVAAKRKQIEAVEKEKQEILVREREVQEILNQAGMKYQSAMGLKSDAAMNPEALAAQSPLRSATQIGSGERGLESFGTPTRTTDVDAMEE